LSRRWWIGSQVSDSLRAELERPPVAGGIVANRVDARPELISYVCTVADVLHEPRPGEELRAVPVGRRCRRRNIAEGVEPLRHRPKGSRAGSSTQQGLWADVVQPHGRHSGLAQPTGYSPCARRAAARRNGRSVRPRPRGRASSRRSPPSSAARRLPVPGRPSGTPSGAHRPPRRPRTAPGQTIAVHRARVRVLPSSRPAFPFRPPNRGPRAEYALNVRREVGTGLRRPGQKHVLTRAAAVVGLTGFEPATFGPPDRRANQAAPQPEKGPSF
jgi:hypothetical protein